MKKKNIFIVAIIILIIAGLSGYFIKNDNEDLNTLDWLVYENKEYGYGFKYPNDLEVIDGKEREYDFYESLKSTFIILPGKYFNIKHPDSKNPETFKNYEIGILRKGHPDEFGNNTEEIIQSFIDPPESVQVIDKDNFTIAIYNKGAHVYIIEKNNVYLLYLRGIDSRDTGVKDWLKNIDDPQLTEWVNDYPDYLKIFEGIYTSFEVIE